MSEIRTCEQYVLAELERLQRENEELREALELMCAEVPGEGRGGGTIPEGRGGGTISGARG